MDEDALQKRLAEAARAGDSDAAERLIRQAERRHDLDLLVWCAALDCVTLKTRRSIAAFLVLDANQPYELHNTDGRSCTLKGAMQARKLSLLQGLCMVSPVRVELLWNAQTARHFACDVAQFVLDSGAVRADQRAVAESCVALGRRVANGELEPDVALTQMELSGFFGGHLGQGFQDLCNRNAAFAFWRISREIRVDLGFAFYDDVERAMQQRLLTYMLDAAAFSA